MIRSSLESFSDVLAPDIKIEEITALEFEFNGFILKRELRHWEIQFKDEEGEQGVIVEREDFVDGKFGFEIDGSENELLLEDFDRIERFVYRNNLID
jgi:hypothetical protein